MRPARRVTVFAPTGLLLALAACSDEDVVPIALRGATMGTTYTVKFFGDHDEASVRQTVDQVLAETNARFSTYDPESEISRFNQHRSVEPFEATPVFVAVLRRALQLAAQTQGAFDPTIYPLVQLYGFGPSGERQIPAPAEISAVLQHVGYRGVTVLADGRVQKARPEIEIDLSAMAKGHGVDQVSAALAASGVTSYMVEIGGEVRCAGVKAERQPWAIGIEGPGGVAAAGLADTVALLDSALATSGSYRNYIAAADGAKAHHVIDPRTGHNADTGVISVSVLAPDCALADALATAFMILGPENAGEVFDAVGVQGLAALFLVRDQNGDVQSYKVRW